MVADFMAQARELLAGGVNERSLNAVGRLLSEVSREPGFIPRTKMKSLHGGDTTSAVLQSDRYRHWRHNDEGQLKVLYEKELGPGSFVTWLDPPHDIHSQQGIGEPALELVLFGKNTMTIPRNYYDPETGEVRTALPQ